FVLLHDGENWITFDPLSTYTDIAVHRQIGAEFDLPGWLQARGHRVVRTTLARAACKPAPWMTFTCVEADKRVLGLRRRFIVTPWQLYRHLVKTTPAYEGELSWEA